MDITQQMDALASVLTELIMKDRNHTRVKEFVQNCGNVDIKKEWDSLTEEKQREISDELYYYLKNKGGQHK